MGMAASQARFLGLTARKTNTEYQGQQVNQQRTALANESAGLYNKMLDLDVPIPPDTNDFYNMRYTYTNAGEKYEIVNYSSSTEGVYDIRTKHSFSTTDPVKNNVTRGLNDDGNGNITALVGGTWRNLTLAQNAGLAESFGMPNTTQFYSYMDNLTGESRYYTQTSVDNNLATQGPSGARSVSMPIDEYTYVTSSDFEYKDFSGVEFDTDSNGAFSRIRLADGTDLPLSSENVRDDAGYEAAMNTYTADKNRYDRVVADINTQTEIIQQQDRTLELRLKQLDTEQSALQTELEAVTKVIEKNVESTFKTFA